MLQETQLGKLAKIQLGVHQQPAESGSIMYLQARHFDSSNRLSCPVDSWLEPAGSTTSHLLTDSDILLVGKGFRNFAWLYTDAIGPAVASSIFFVIKPKDETVLPRYLVTLFNLPQTQQYFQTLGAGSSIPSIRKSELEALPVTVPNMAIQRKVVELQAIHEQEVRLSQTLMSEKQLLFEAVAQKMIRGEIHVKI